MSCSTDRKTSPLPFCRGFTLIEAGWVIGGILLFPALLRHCFAPAQLTLMLLRLTSVRLLSLLWILSRVSSTLVGFGGSSGKILKGSGFTTPAGGTTSKVRRNILRRVCPVCNQAAKRLSNKVSSQMKPLQIPERCF